MNVVLPIVLTGAGALVLLLAWNRLLVHLAMPSSVGEWLLATFWLPCLAGLPLLGFLLQGHGLTPQGVSITAAALAGAWLLSVVTSVWSCRTSLKACRVAEQVAAAHQFDLSTEVVEKKLLPRKLVHINPYLKHTLAAHDRGFVAHAATTAGNGDSRADRGMRFATVVVVEGIVVRMPVILSRIGNAGKGGLQREEKRREILEALGLGRLEFDGLLFSAIGGASFDEIEAGREAAMELGGSLLELISRQLTGFLRHVASIYLAEGRIVVLMRERVRESGLLEQCLRCVEELSMWSPTALPTPGGSSEPLSSKRR